MLRIKKEGEVLAIELNHEGEFQTEQFVGEAKRQLEELLPYDRPTGELLKIKVEDAQVVAAFVVAYVTRLYDVVCVWAADIKRFVVVASRNDDYEVGEFLF